MAHRNASVPPKCAAGVLRISDEKTLQLVQLHAEEECLWNPNSIGYKNREMRNLAAEKIATILDLPNFTAHHVMSKFKNLRNSYSQELKKIAASVALCDSEEYRPRVMWFETMDSFLRPHLRGSVTWLVRDDHQNGKDKEDERSQPSTERLSSASSGSEHEAGASAPPPPPGRKRRRRHTSQGSPDERSVGNRLSEVQAQLSTLLARQEDQHATFGQHVASLMRALPARRALALQPQLLLLIAEELEAARAADTTPPPAPPPPPHDDELILPDDEDNTTNMKIEVDESD